MLQRCQPLSKSPPDGVKAALWLSVLAVGAQLRGSGDGRRLWQIPHHQEPCQATEPGPAGRVPRTDEGKLGSWSQTSRSGVCTNTGHKKGLPGQ